MGRFTTIVYALVPLAIIAMGFLAMAMLSEPSPARELSGVPVHMGAVPAELGTACDVAI